MEKKLIIFDCYGTLLTSPKSNPHSKFLENIGVNSRKVKKKIITESNINWFSLADINLNSITFKKHHDIFQLEMKIVLSEIEPYFQEMSVYLDELRKKYTVVILSNLSEEYALPIESIYLPMLIIVFILFVTGKAKPDVNSYEDVIEWYKNNRGDITPRNIILVDDHSQNINSANSMGIQGVLVNNSHIDSPFSIKAFLNWIQSLQD